MTEQLERELTELFHARAESLDVLPPLPAAQVRRARFQSGLAMASVIAVLAGGVVAGERLVGHSGNDRATLGSSPGDATHELERIFARMRAGRWHVDVTFALNPAGLAPAASSADYDGVAQTAIARTGGKVTMIEAGGQVYVPLPADPELAKFLPAGARWQQVLGGTGVASASMFPNLAYTGTSSGDVDLSRNQVTRTATGYRLVENDGPSRHAVFNVRIGSDGTVTAMHGVITPRAGNAGPVTSLTVDATFTKLTRPFHVVAPDPRTVVTEMQFQAAVEKSNGAGGTIPTQPQACRTTSTTDANGSQSGTVECSSQLTVTGSIGSGTGSGTPGFSTRPAPTPSHT